MNKYINLTNGETDGIALFYLKDKNLYCVVMNKEQSEVLDISLGIIFKDKLRITDIHKESMYEMLEGCKRMTHKEIIRTLKKVKYKLHEADTEAAIIEITQDIEDLIIKLEGDK